CIGFRMKDGANTAPEGASLRLRYGSALSNRRSSKPGALRGTGSESEAAGSDKLIRKQLETDRSADPGHHHTQHSWGLFFFFIPRLHSQKWGICIVFSKSSNEAAIPGLDKDRLSSNQEPIRSSSQGLIEPCDAPSQHWLPARLHRRNKSVLHQKRKEHFSFRISYTSESSSRGSMTPLSHNEVESATITQICVPLTNQVKLLPQLLTNQSKSSSSDH
ncbi:hypothetical protein DNTS_008230, partial [Danionella cerebrum]